MSRSRDFSLARAYFFPREAVILATPNIPRECTFCKNFYTFHSCFLCIWFATKLRAKCGKCRFAPQKMQIFKQKCHQKKKTHFFAFMQKTGREVYRIGVLGAEMRKIRTKKRHFSHKPKNNRITLIFNTLNKNHCIF